MRSTKSYLKKIFGHTIIKLSDKLTSTTNKEKNQIIVKNINTNKKRTSRTKKNDAL